MDTSHTAYIYIYIYIYIEREREIERNSIPDTKLLEDVISLSACDCLALFFITRSLLFFIQLHNTLPILYHCVR